MAKVVARTLYAPDPNQPPPLANKGVVAVGQREISSREKGQEVPRAARMPDFLAIKDSCCPFRFLRWASPCHHQGD